MVSQEERVDFSAIRSHAARDDAKHLATHSTAEHNFHALVHRARTPSNVDKMVWQCSQHRTCGGSRAKCNNNRDKSLPEEYTYCKLSKA